MDRVIKTVLLLFIAVIISLKLMAQDEHHLEFKYEAGVSNGIVYNFAEEETAYGLHVYFIKKIGISRKIGIGIGYEAIFDEHEQNTFSVLLHYNPIYNLSINLAPGLVFLESQPKSSRFALHAEIIYNFKIGIFNLGPLIGVAFNPEDAHASLGLHMSVGF